VCLAAQHVYPFLDCLSLCVLGPGFCFCVIKLVFFGMASFVFFESAFVVNSTNPMVPR